MTIEYKLRKSVSWDFFLKNVIITYIVHLLFYGILIWFNKIEEDLAKTVLLAISIAWFLFFATPAILLFTNHIKNSKGVSLRINNGKFVYRNRSKVIEFELEDIKKVEVYLTPPSYDKRTDFLYLGIFFYTSVYINNGDKIELSSMVLNQYNKYFPKAIIERKKKFFPFMSKG